MKPEDIPLRDLHLPEMTGWWPLAPGWWVLLALLLISLLLLLRHAYRRWRHNAPRRHALRRLALIRQNYEHGVDPVELGHELSELLRRAMLAYAPRRQVAGLTGDDWLQWLDRGMNDAPFSAGPGQVIDSLPYMNPGQVDNDTDVSGLLDAVSRRLKTPLVGDRV